MDGHSHGSARCHQKIQGTVLGQTEHVEVCWWDCEFPGPTIEEKVGPGRWTSDFWSVTCVPPYLCFLLQYTKRLSKRKNTRSWIFPEEIFSRTPHMSISVQVSVMLDPWVGKKWRWCLIASYQLSYVILFLLKSVFVFIWRCNRWTKWKFKQYTYLYTKLRSPSLPLSSWLVSDDTTAVERFWVSLSYFTYACIH